MATESTQYALWDKRREVVFSIYQKDEETGEIVGDPRPTGVPRSPNPDDYVEMRYIHDTPEDFIERFPRLLGLGTVEVLDENTLIMRYPDADFSEEAVRGELRRMVNEEANKILQRSDWYVVRQFETGKRIPGDVMRGRQRVRDDVDVASRQIENLKGAALMTYEWEFTDVHGYDRRP